MLEVKPGLNVFGVPEPQLCVEKRVDLSSSCGRQHRNKMKEDLSSLESISFCVRAAIHHFLTEREIFFIQHDRPVHSTTARC